MLQSKYMTRGQCSVLLMNLAGDGSRSSVRNFWYRSHRRAESSGYYTRV